MQPQIRYATTSDGVSIAYCVEGEGPPIVVCPHLFESFSLEYLFPDLHKVRQALSAGHRVLRYDVRGAGLSQRDPQDVSHAALVRDLEAVIEASGMSRFALIATGFSGAVGIDYASRHPDIVDRLVLWGAEPRFADAMPAGALQGWAEFARTNWRLAAQVIADADPGTRSELPNSDAMGFGEMLRESLTGEMAARIMLQQMQTSDVRALLRRVNVPTLVIEREKHVRRGQAVAAGIPGAQFFVRQGGASWFVFEHARPAIDAIRSFLGDTDAQQAAATDVVPGVRTVLFTDIVGHTEMMRRLGDARGREVLREHERLAREAIAKHGGTEIKTDGDSFMVSFVAVSSAVECAVALQRAFALHSETNGEPIVVRMGLNVGEPIEEDGDFFGSAVILGARIKDQASGREILVPEAVRHMLSGKNFLFSDRGDFVLKGYEDAVRLYEVRWQE